MPAHLIDTNILVRLSNTSDSLDSVATHTVATLRRAGHTLNVSPQNLIEFRNAATRPTSANGLGMSAADADAEAASVEGMVAPFAGNSCDLSSLDGAFAVRFRDWFMTPGSSPSVTSRM